MSGSLGPSEKESIRKLDQQLGDLIQDMQDGKPNIGKVFYIGQQLAFLTQNKHIPENVKQKLQAALSDLQSEKFPNLEITKIIDAKKEIDQALEEN